MEVALYPFEYMRITQRHDEGNHLAHWYPKPNPLYSDKPWDEACKDGGKSYFTPFNDYKVIELMGNQTKGCSVRLESVNKLKIPIYEEPVKIELTLTHMDESNMKKVKVGDILKKGSKILMEGTSGITKGAHFHCTINVGVYSGYYKNSNKKYVFAYKKSLLPNEAFYVDTTKTEILNSKKYVFIGVNYFMGMQGEEVEKIDEFLSSNVKGNLYGKYTFESIKVFQEKEKLKPTGNVDLETFEKLLEKGAKI